MSEANKAVVRRAFEAFNSRNLDVMDEVYAKGVTYHGGRGVEIGSLQGWREYLNTILIAFPDMHDTVEAIIAEGDLVAAHHTGSGTHEGGLEGIPPTGKKVTGIRGISIYRFSGGKVVEQWEVFDELGLMQQLGVVPTPG